MSEPSPQREGAPHVRRIGPGVPYVDGSEDYLLRVLQEARDRSSGSDELAAHIADWPTRYHLSHQRTNLLRPLRIRPGAKVLDVGAGTGALARYLGEQGADVLALEGNMARAEVAALRCDGLSSVEVVCGTIQDLPDEERFDLVTVIGVLEYSGAAIGGGWGPDRLLEAVRERLRPGGAMALAIENQFGLKYLLGGAEDHLGAAWVGIEDYPGPPGPRTWSRRQLRSMLDAAGLSDQVWLAPLPDYKLPSLVLHEAIYEQEDAEELVDQLVARPVSFADHPPVRLGDAAAAHRALVRAGLGLDVASSFLVVAGRDNGDAAALVAPDILAWSYGGDRRARWRRHRALTADRTLRSLSADRGERSEGWLRQDPGGTRPYLPGATLGQAVDAALRAHDLDALVEVLGRWWAHLAATAQTSELGQRSDHPFAAASTDRALPDGYLDVGPANFVDRDGTLVLIDDEWRVGGPVDLDLAVIRALWVLSREIVTSGISHPWGDLATIDEVFADLCAMLPVDASAENMDRFRQAEVALQQLLSGASEEELRSGWLDGGRRGADDRPDRMLQIELDHVRATLRGAQDDLEVREREVARLHELRASMEAALAAKDAEIVRLKTLRGFARAGLARSATLRRVAQRLRR